MGISCLSRFLILCNIFLFIFINCNTLDEFQDALLDAGAVPKLLALINSSHEDISWQAAGALRNIVLNNCLYLKC